MNTLLTFDSTPFIKHIVPSDDSSMVDYIIREYGPALEAAIATYNNEDFSFHIRTYYQDAYFKAILVSGNSFDEDYDSSKVFRKRVVDEEGNVSSTKGRYDELVDICTETFNQQCIAVLRGIQMQSRKIYTVEVVGYENRTLKILLKTDGEIIP